MSLRSIHNRRNFLSDYWLGTLAGTRGLAGRRLSAAETRTRMRRLTRLVDAIAGAERLEPARFRERFARPLLADVFDFAMADHDTPSPVYALRPLVAAPSSEPFALAWLCNDIADLDRPALRNALQAALADAGLDHGLILAPSVLRMIRSAGDGPRLASLDVALTTLRELEDESSLQTAYRLFSAGTFVPGDDGRRPIDLLEDESREHSARVSTELKAAVFAAAELLVGAFQRDVSSRPEAFADRPPTPAQVRDAGFLALYRILFILYAEARDERLAAHRLYRESYGLEGVIGDLLAVAVETLAGNRTKVWARLGVLFRVFNEGLAPNLPNLENIPPRGGQLFSDTTPEGSLLKRLRVDDRIAREVLLAIATTRPRRGVGRERVSFRELEIEQLGSVYEGLLEYEPAVADELQLGVRLSGRMLVVTPEELVTLCERKGLVLTGEPALVAGTVAERLHPSYLPDEDESEEEEDGNDEDGDDEEEESDWKIKKGQPVRLLRRIQPGAFHFRAGGARKASGSYYTPTPMVDYLVRHALNPLTGGKSPGEIEQLRVVDLACGSAHFLVGAARLLGEALHEAYRRELGDRPPASFLPEGGAAQQIQLRWEAEGAAWCKRRVVERCLYGVDLNPAAVQLAQVALWIESLAGDRPLSFFAHHIRVGNSLQGTFAERFDAPPDPRLAPRRDVKTLGLFESSIRARIEAALGERRLIDAELPPEIRADTPEEFAYKEDRLRRSESTLADARLLMDLRSASPFLPAIWSDLPSLIELVNPESAARSMRWWDDFERVRARECFFHWELEFPEVLLRAERPGFDAVLGNPPWDKVLPSKKEFYADLDPVVLAFKGHELDRRIRELHARHAGLEPLFDAERERTTTFARVLRHSGDFPLATPVVDEEEGEESAGRGTRRKPAQRAHEDLSKYFVDRALRLVREGGAVGLVVPSVVYNGDGCVGIRQHLLRRTRVAAFYAFENRRKIFPIHASYKFANVVARPGGDGSGAFDAAFMRWDPAELSDDAPKPWSVRVTRDEVEWLSPETLAFLEYRSPRDQEIVRKMSVGKPTLGGRGAGAWGTRLISWRQHEIVYNSSADKDLFGSGATGGLHSPASILSTDAPDDPATLLQAMRSAGYWPVYEGKHVEQYLVGVKPVRWWLSVAEAKAKYGRFPREAATVVFRDLARNTDQRTCIAALLPAGAAASHTCNGAKFENVQVEAALTVLNSFCFDSAAPALGGHPRELHVHPAGRSPAGRGGQHASSGPHPFRADRRSQPLGR